MQGGIHDGRPFCVDSRSAQPFSWLSRAFFARPPAWPSGLWSSADCWQEGVQAAQVELLHLFDLKSALTCGHLSPISHKAPLQTHQRFYKLNSHAGEKAGELCYKLYQ